MQLVPLNSSNYKRRRSQAITPIAGLGENSVTELLLLKFLLELTEITYCKVKSCNLQSESDKKTRNSTKFYLIHTCICSRSTLHAIALQDKRRMCIGEDYLKNSKSKRFYYEIINSFELLKAPPPDATMLYEKLVYKSITPPLSEEAYLVLF